MGNSLRTKTFNFESENTCKGIWTFKFSGRPGHTIIDSVEIHEKEPRQGCLGHHWTIMALITGRSLADIDIAALEEIKCNREVSCPQALARCLKEMQP
jgi:hypothetical protein